MKVLFINNRDSFVWNLVDYVSRFEPQTIVMPNTTTVEQVRQIRPDAIIISPGPGSPNDSRDIGHCLDIIRELGPEIPILGVCLGHQAINIAYGGTIAHSPGGPVHGKVSPVEHVDDSLFEGIEPVFDAARYHSLAIDQVASHIKVIASISDGMVMAIKHDMYPVYGLQFHPESILTKKGMDIIGNFLKIAGGSLTCDN